MSDKDLTTITLTKETRTRLKEYGIKGESWNTTVNKVLNELDVCRKENTMLSELRELIFGPIKHHIMESTNEEIDKLELGDEFYSEFEQRLKRFWKRFSKTTIGDKWTEKEIE